MTEVTTIHTKNPNQEKIDSAFQAFIDSVEKLSKETIDDLENLVSDDFHFRDPLIDTKDYETFSNYLKQTYDKLSDIHFVVNNRSITGQVAFVESAMSYIYRGVKNEVSMVSRLTFNEKGELTEEIDYWDSYECMKAVPIIGSLLNITRKIMV